MAKGADKISKSKQESPPAVNTFPNTDSARASSITVVEMVFCPSVPSCSMTANEEEEEATLSSAADNPTGQAQQPAAEHSSSSTPECRESGLSSHLTLVNFIKGMIGSGILTLPIVFRQAGLWTAFGLVFLFGFLNSRTMASLVHCANQLAASRREKGQPRQPMSYGDVMEAALSGSFLWARPWAWSAKLFVNGTIVLLQMGIGCIKYNFIVAHLRELFGEFTSFHASALTWALLIFPPMVLLNFTRTLQRIALLNSVGNLFMFCAYGIIFFHLLQPPYRTAQLPWIASSPSGVLTACGSILYCFEGQAMLLPMENKMRRPAHMLGPFGVLSTGMALTAIFDAAVGFLGYAKFGDSIQGSVTLNLPVTPLLTCVKVVFTAISFLDYLLQQYVTIQMLWPPLGRQLSRLVPSSSADWLVSCCEYLFRASLVAITMLIAIFVPNLEQIMPLVGFSGGVFLAFVFPPLIDIFTFVPMLMADEQKSWTAMASKLAVNGCFLTVGLTGSLAGLRTSLADILLVTNK